LKRFGRRFFLVLVVREQAEKEDGKEEKGALNAAGRENVATNMWKGVRAGT